MSRNALATLNMANLAAIARGENIAGISDDNVGEMFDDDDDDIEGLDDDDDDDDDIEGISDDDIGAMSPAKLKRLRALAKRAARSRKRRKPSWKGRRVLPLPETNIGAGATETIQASPLHYFKAQRLVIEGTNINDFVINQIVIRGTSQLEATGAVPAALFAGDASDVNFVFDTCPPNSTIDLQVTNSSAGALDFRAAFLGLYR